MNQEEPDRVPIGEFSLDHDHVSRILGRHTYWRNRKDSTLALWQGRRDELVQSLKTDYTDLIEQLDYDIIPVHLVPSRHWVCSDPPRQIKGEIWQDSSGTIYKYCAGNDSFMCVSHPPPKVNVNPEEINAAMAAIDYDESQFELVDHICHRFAKDRVIVLRDFNIDNRALNLPGGDQTHKLMMPLLNPDAVRAACRYALSLNRKLLDMCRHRAITIMMYERDYGDNTGCIESPRTIRVIYTPFGREFVRWVQSMGKTAFIHCCGRIWDILSDLVVAGFAGDQSVRESAEMNLAELKRQYGRQLTLWAGLQCETLCYGTVGEVERSVKQALQTCMPGGGFIFGSSNSVRFGADTDNYLRALDIVRRYGVY